MKPKSLLFLLLSISSLSLHAGWITTNMYTLEDTDDSDSIMVNIGQFKSLQNMLIGMNFVSPNKPVVTRLSGHIDSVHWENDDNCQIPNSESIEKHILASVNFEYYTTDNPESTKLGAIFSLMKGTPCDIKVDIKRTISLNNNLQTIVVRQ